MVRIPDRAVWQDIADAYEQQNNPNIIRQEKRRQHFCGQGKNYIFQITDDKTSRVSGCMISASGHFKRDRNKKVQQPDKKGIHEAGDHHNGNHGKRAGDH